MSNLGIKPDQVLYCTFSSGANNYIHMVTIRIRDFPKCFFLFDENLNYFMTIYEKDFILSLD